MKNNFIKLITLLTVAVINTSCSTTEEVDIDTTAPKVLIESPSVNQTYVGYWGGAWPEADKVIIKALGVDDTKIESIKLTVLNEIGTIVFEKTVNSVTNTQTKLVISASYTPTEIGTYSLVFTAIDLNGNIENSVSRNFTVK